MDRLRFDACLPWLLLVLGLPRFVPGFADDLEEPGVPLVLAATAAPVPAPAPSSTSPSRSISISLVLSFLSIFARFVASAASCRACATLPCMKPATSNGSAMSASLQGTPMARMLAVNSCTKSAGAAGFRLRTAVPLYIARCSSMGSCGSGCMASPSSHSEVATCCAGGAAGPLPRPTASN